MAAEHGCQNVATAVSDMSCNFATRSFLSGGGDSYRGHDCPIDTGQHNGVT